MTGALVARFSLLSLLGLAAGPPSPALGILLKAAPPDKEMPEADRKAAEKALDARYDETLKAWQVLDKELVKRFGKKRDKWPAEQRLALRTAAERTRAVEAERRYLKPDPNAADSVDDLRKRIAGTKRLREVSSAREAHFVVEVLARKTSYGVGSRNRLLVKITLGEQIGKKRRQAVDWGEIDWPYPRGTEDWTRDVLHSCSLKEPWWTIQEAMANGWGAVANGLVSGMDEFVKENHEVLTGVEPGR